MSEEIPLFPLNVVLFPGGPLPLRIFEPRYVSMVGRCLREGLPFGVVAIAGGEEAGSPASFHALGTSARIVDFDQLPDGMLGITARGERRFRVLGHRVQPDQLVIGEVEWLPSPPRLPVPQEYGGLTALLRRVLAAEAVRPYAALLELDWGDAGWLCNRLAEILPLPDAAKLALLEIGDPQQRLDVLYALLQEQRLV